MTATATATEFQLDISHLTKKPSELAYPNLILFYGKAGSGKSWLAASAAEVEMLAPVLIIDTEGSTAGTVSGFDDEFIDILPVNSHAEFESIMKALATKTHKYKTVIVDTYDVAQERAIAHYMKTTFNNKGELDTRAAWGEVKLWTIRTARALEGMDALGIIVNHETVDKTESGAMLTTVLLGGSAKDVLPGIPGVIGYTVRGVKDGKEVTTVQFAADTKKATKNRFHLPQTMTDPTMAKIYQYIEDNRKNGEKK